MNKARLKKAKRLAARQYQVRIFADETTDGEPGYYAMMPEMPGCVSDGATVEEAKENLESARVDFIYFLLEDGLTVPEPKMASSPVRIDMFEYMGLDVVPPRPEVLEGANIVTA